MIVRRKKRPLKTRIKRYILLAVFLLIPTFSFTRFYFSETVSSYAANKAKMHMSMIVNDAISKEVVPNIITEDLMLFKTKTNGHVTNVLIDVYQINNVIAKMTTDMQTKLHHRIVSEELEMPMGAMFSHPLLNRMGPTVKIEIQMVGNIKTDIITRATPYGINNSLMEVMIKTEIDFLVFIPYQKQELTLVTYTPLVIKMIQGEVPQYYYSSSNGSFITPPRDEYGFGD